MNNPNFKQSIVLSLESATAVFYTSCLHANLLFPISPEICAILIRAIIKQEIMSRCRWYNDYGENRMTILEYENILAPFNVTITNTEKFLDIVDDVVGLFSDFLAPYFPFKTWQVLYVDNLPDNCILVGTHGDYRILQWHELIKTGQVKPPFNYDDETFLSDDT